MSINFHFSQSNSRIFSGKKVNLKGINGFLASRNSKWAQPGTLILAINSVRFKKRHALFHPLFGAQGLVPCRRHPHGAMTVAMLFRSLLVELRLINLNGFP